jgi:Ca-activated chloride channel family protein
MTATANLTLSPEKPATLKGLATKVKVLMQLKAPTAPHELERDPLNLSVVLDRSGSMAGDPLDKAKQCAAFVQSRLSTQDRLSLVIYDDKVEVAASSQPASPHNEFKSAVQSIDPGGCTNLVGGWQAGNGQVELYSSDYKNNRVLLLSDGRLNAGITNPEEIRALCKEVAKREIKTSTYGLGAHFDEEVMCLIAEETGGNARYGEEIEDLLEGFIEELDLLANLYSGQLMLSIEPREGVEVEVANRFVKKGDQYMLPDLAYDAEIWGGLILSVSPEAAESQEPLVTLKVESSDGELNMSAQLEALQILSPEAYDAVVTEKGITDYFAELQIAELKVEASNLARRGEWEQVEALLQRMKALPMTPVQAAEFEELKKLFAQRQLEIFAKESRFSASSSRTVMKSDMASYAMSAAWAPSPSAQAAPVPSYLKQKARRGKANVRDKK